ncbi:fumarate hydratase class I [Bradyrhizobium sp. LM2.7]
MNAPTAFPDPSKPVPPYKHTPLFPLGKDETPYKKITAEGVRVEKVLGKDMLVVSREALRALSEAAFGDINHYLRPGHLKQLRAILEDGEASPNDKFVALDFLKNANIAAGGVLPMCQDTGTAIIMGKKGCNVITDGDDEAALSEGARDAYLRRNLRYSQVAPLSMYEEKNTANNMPAQCEIYAEGGSSEVDSAYKFMFMAKGGGSANKSFLFQATPSVLTRDRLLAFLKEKILTLGTAACPPYHLAIVIGGTSAELCMKTVKLASARYLDALPTHGSPDGNAFRDVEMEQEIHKMTQSLGVGAQFGGKYFCHDVRVIRMPRHGASLPIGLGVSCSADRQVLGKITKDGVYLEELEHNPAQYLPEVEQSLGGEVVKIDLNQPMKDILATFSQYPIKTRVSMTGTMIVARDSAHAKLRERLEKGETAVGLLQEPSGVLRRPRQDARGLCLRCVRPDHRGTHGFLRRPVSGRRRLDGDGGEGQPRAGRARGLQEIWRLLSRLDRRGGGEPRRALHQEGRGARISRARHGSDLAHRGRRFPRLHHHRRQGQRLLQGVEPGLALHLSAQAGRGRRES